MTTNNRFIRAFTEPDFPTEPGESFGRDDEKRALLTSVVRIIDRCRAGENKKPGEAWIEDEMSRMRSFRSDPPKGGGGGMMIL
ncbi:MAG: hypothetical protein JRD68_00205 [Deltaproteobacteria bacterium]|nr:hypothetical protein [Deltaproteobacteria bacterium]